MPMLFPISNLLDGSIMYKTILSTSLSTVENYVLYTGHFGMSFVHVF